MRKYAIKTLNLKTILLLINGQEIKDENVKKIK